MKPAPFDLLIAETLDEACEALAASASDTKVIAGGQSLMAMLNMRLLEPRRLLDIARVGELAGVRLAGDRVHVGAATTQADLEHWPELAGALPLVALAIPHLGHRQTRNRGTVGGSLAHADPSAELALCLALLEGEVVLRTSSGARTVAASEFQLGMLQTCLAPDELLVEVRLPRARPADRFAFEEFSPRQGDFAIVSVAAWHCERGMRLAVGGAMDRPHLVSMSDDACTHASTRADALNALAWSLPLQNDAHASASLRRKLVRTLGERVVKAAYVGPDTPQCPS